MEKNQRGQRIVKWIIAVLMLVLLAFLVPSPGMMESRYAVSAEAKADGK